MIVSSKSSFVLGTAQKKEELPIDRLRTLVHQVAAQCREEAIRDVRSCALTRPINAQKEALTRAIAAYEQFEKKIKEGYVLNHGLDRASRLELICQEESEVLDIGTFHKELESILTARTCI